MTILKDIALVMLMSTMVGTSQASDLKETAAWGKLVKGIQLRLSADSTVVGFGEIPSFKCDVRNNGKHKWELPLSQREYVLEVDGHLFTYPGKAEKWKLIKSGDELRSIAIQANSGWGRDGMFSYYQLALRPGKHTIRLGVLPRPARRILPPKPALCMSDPVTIEVAPLEGMGEDMSPLGMTIFGKRNTLKLSSWNRRGGNCGIDFESGRVMAMPIVQPISDE
jgi:hypothetical protein